LLPALLLLSTTIFALPMARLADRFGKRRVIGAGYALVAAIGLGGLVITTKQQGAIVLILAGIGNAPGQVLAVPFLADLVPKRHIGAATGILAGSGSVAAPLASLLAGSLANVYGPRIIFLVMSIAVSCALLLLFFVRAPVEGFATTPIGATAAEQAP
jgi:MFS family permease